jgi:4-hydroxybenzoyl-CoA thioesterase
MPTKLVSVNPMPLYVHERTIPFGDTDAAAIVYTPRFSDYCMEAAEVWFSEYLEFDWYRVNTQLGLGTPVVHMQIDFKAPLRGGDKLCTETRVARLGRTSVALSLRGGKVEDDFDNQSLVFEAEYVFCFTGANTNGAMPIPDKQRQLIEDYQGAWIIPERG